MPKRQPGPQRAMAEGVGRRRTRRRSDCVAVCLLLSISRAIAVNGTVVRLLSFHAVRLPCVCARGRAGALSLDDDENGRVGWLLVGMRTARRPVLASSGHWC